MNARVPVGTRLRQILLGEARRRIVPCEACGTAFEHFLECTGTSRHPAAANSAWRSKAQNCALRKRGDSPDKHECLSGLVPIDSRLLHVYRGNSLIIPKLFLWNNKEFESSTSHILQFTPPLGVNSRMRRWRDSNSRGLSPADFPGLWNEPLSDTSNLCINNHHNAIEPLQPEADPPWAESDTSNRTFDETLL